MGDAAGVGPELCLRTLADPAILGLCRPVVFGQAAVLERVGRAAQIPWPESLQVLDAPGQLAPGGPAIVNCADLDTAAIQPGQVSSACGGAAFNCIRAAIEAALANQVAAVVTAPIHKESLHLAGVPYPGHTEIFAALTGAARACMMLWSERLTVSMVTTHVGYAEVPRCLSVERILDVIELTAEGLQRINRRPPRLGICGLNPHAGEHGLFGQGEEERGIAPAVERARKEGIMIDGPLPPDAAFTDGQRRRFDGIVCMYHDQGHIPFKMLAFDDGVNITLGTSIVRTSVDHGTAFDIAWQGRARPTSLFKAVECAVRLSQTP